MIENVGKLDQKIRYVLALLFIILAIWISPWFWILAIVFIVTAFFRYCPLYAILKITSNPPPKRKLQ